MGKIIFWLIVVFTILFVLRLVNTSKARRRSASDAGTARRPTDAGAMVRCVRCGVFLPRVDALPSPGGFTCGDAACGGKSR